MVSALPPRQRLARVLRGLARQLPGQVAVLLGDRRFADGRAALGRLGDDAALRAAVDAIGPDEAAWLADQLLERWRRLGPVTLEPEAAIDGPDEIWVGATPVRVELAVLVVDAEPGGDVIWDGATAGPDPTRAVVVITSPGDAAATLSVRAHVRARAATGRVALVATARIAVRAPRVVVSDDRTRLIATDQTGRPAVGAPVTVGPHALVAGPGGLVVFDVAPEPGAAIHVHGVLAGRVPP